MYIKNPLVSKKMKINVVVILFPVCTVLNTVCIHICGYSGTHLSGPQRSGAFGLPNYLGEYTS